MQVREDCVSESVFPKYLKTESTKYNILFKINSQMNRHARCLKISSE